MENQIKLKKYVSIHESVCLHPQIFIKIANFALAKITMFQVGVIDSIQLNKFGANCV